MTIPVQFPEIRPQVIGGNLPQPRDPLQGFLEAFLQSRDRRDRNSRSSAEHQLELARIDLQKRKLDIEVQEAKTRTEAQKAQAIALKEIMPYYMQMGGAASLMGQQQGVPMQQQPALPPSVDPTTVAVGSALNAAPANPTLAGALQNLPPDVLASLVQKDGPLTQLRELGRDARRALVAAKFQGPLDGNETQEQTVARLGKMAGEYAKIGDHSMVASMAEAIGVLRARPDQYEWFQNKDGTTVYLPKEEGSRLRLQKPQATSIRGFGFGPGGPVGVIRAITAIAGMRDAHDKMKRFEVKVASKQADYTDLDFFRGKLATMYDDANKETGAVGHVVPFFGTASGAMVLARLNRTNPDLANYLQSAAFWALEESVLANRPSDFRTKMDEFVSAIKPDAKVQSIHDLWTARGVRLAGFEQGVPALQALLNRATSMIGAPGVVLDPIEH